MLPSLARRAIPVLDVVQPPLDLGGRVGLPVVAEGGHLAARQRLRDTIGARRTVVGLVVPVALAGPQLVQAWHLIELPPALEQLRAADRLDSAVAAARGGDRAVVLGPVGAPAARL